MKLRSLVSLAAAALVLSAGRDAAADPAGLRYGFDAAGGPLIVPGLMTVGFFGPHAQVGVRLPAYLGVYAEGDLDFIVGKVGGFYLAGALVTEYKFTDDISAGIGPEVGYYQVHQSSGFQDYGLLYGGRLHLSWIALIWHTDNFVGIGQRDFQIYENTILLSLDLRLVVRPGSFPELGNTSWVASGRTLAFLPTVSIGWHTDVFP